MKLLTGGKDISELVEQIKWSGDTSSRVIPRSRRSFFKVSPSIMLLSLTELAKNVEQFCQHLTNESHAKSNFFLLFYHMLCEKARVLSKFFEKFLEKSLDK